MCDKEAWLLRDHLNRSTKARSKTAEAASPLRPALLSLRTAVILAIATAHWSAPASGLGAWLTLVIGLDSVIDREA
jgi:hypothetical protein